MKSKSEIENEIIRRSAEAFRDAALGSDQTITWIAEKSMIGRGYFDELKDGKKRLNIVHLVKTATALNKYPSELLPIEWQKPHFHEVEPHILGEAIREILTNSKDQKKQESLMSFEQQCQAIGLLYNKKLEEKNHKGEIVTINNNS